MPTHLRLPTTLLTLLLHFTALTFATGATFQCNSETSPKFHQDCIVASNFLVLSINGNDGQAHIPTAPLAHTFGTCQAGIQATGGEKRIQGTNLLLSYAQIGARCQDGYFSYENGAVDGTLKGQAYWKRSSPRDLKPLGGISTSPKKIQMEAVERRDMHNQQHIFEPKGVIMGARRGGNDKIYELVLLSAHGVTELAPTSEKISGLFIERVREFLQHNLVREDNIDLAFGNAYQIQGATHVTLMSMGVSLRGGQTTWKAFVEGMADGGAAFKKLVEDAVWNFAVREFVAGYYKVVTTEGEEVLAIIIYGYNSVDSAVPE
ncbi:hypothetical protein ABW19_dt0208793 [Dactylella cylindrospora]|nr:hypothetical protein ABW19_dt0208793 [Dactylella cylindrospora]